MSALSPDHRSIFASVVALSFAAHQEQDCIDFIAKQHANLEVVPISDEAQLTLKADGRISDTNYRFNIISFFAICNAISMGLGRVFGEISGETPSKLAQADLFSVPAAVSIYNSAMRVKFESLRERNLLINHGFRVIDGFMGLNHRMLDNAAFFELVRERVAQLHPAAAFYRAELVGREFRLYIIDTQTKRTDIYEDPAHTFASGWYFCNREDSGQAIKAIPCLYTRFGIATAAEQNNYRLVHTGSDLFGKTTAMVNRSLESAINMDELKLRVKELCSQKLGFTEDRRQFDAVCGKLVFILTQRGISKPTATNIVKNAANVGADIEARNPLDVFTNKVLAARSAYDLFCAICRHARGQPTDTREKLQVVAMELLFSKSKNPSRQIPLNIA
jgi:hypothetical protein